VRQIGWSGKRLNVWDHFLGIRPEADSAAGRVQGYPLRKDYDILQQDTAWVREILESKAGSEMGLAVKRTRR